MEYKEIRYEYNYMEINAPPEALNHPV